MRQKEPRYYILVGDPETWQVALNSCIWGFSEASSRYWNSSEVGDSLAFYATSPIKKIIGFGRIMRKYVDDSILFPDEILFRKPMWTYRLEFEKYYVIDDWKGRGISVPSSMMLNMGRRVVDPKTFQRLMRQAERKWQVKIQEKS